MRQMVHLKDLNISEITLHKIDWTIMNNMCPTDKKKLVRMIIEKAAKEMAKMRNTKKNVSELKHELHMISDTMANAAVEFSRKDMQIEQAVRLKCPVCRAQMKNPRIKCGKHFNKEMTSHLVAGIYTKE